MLRSVVRGVRLALGPSARCVAHAQLRPSIARRTFTAVAVEHAAVFEIDPAAPAPTPMAPEVAQPTSDETPRTPVPVRPRGRHVRKARPTGDAWALPPPPTITSEAEFEVLKRKGHVGENTYDMLTCYQLGVLYFDGIPPAAASKSFTTTTTAAASSDATPTAAWSLPKNYTQSLLWFTNAAFEGHVPSRTRLGVMYLAGYGIKRNIPIAFQLFTESSEMGDRDAQAHLASMYMQGVGAPKKDVAKAIEWYTQAADRGHIRAQAVLAKILDTPEAGAARDPDMASHWLRESARAGHTESQFHLAQRCAAEGDQPQAFEWYTKTARNGHAEAQYLLGCAYASNAPLVAHQALEAARRHEEAARHFSRAADQGHVHAQGRLGFRLFHGIGCKHDRSTAIMWLNNAAEANHVDAQLMLGTIAYAEYLKMTPPADAPPAPVTYDANGEPEEDQKLKTAKHYFGKVLENANKNCTTLPAGSLPLLVRITQDPSLPTRLLDQYRERIGEPWLGDIHPFLVEVIAANKNAASNATAAAASAASNSS